MLAGVLLCSCGHGVDPEPTASTEQATESGDYPTFDGTTEEAVLALVACLEDDGWEVEMLHSNEGLGFQPTNLNDSQLEAYNSAIEACLHEVGVPAPLFTSEEIVLQWYALLMKQHDCLVDAGYSPSDPPSEATFVDSWRRTGAPDWDPIATISAPDWDAALASCARPRASDVGR